MKLVNEHRVNVMVVGDGMVGKSSLVKCLLGRPFTQEYRTTVFLDRYEEVIQTDITKFILNITDFSMEVKALFRHKIAWDIWMNKVMKYILIFS